MWATTLRFLTRWWPPLVAAGATLAYAVAILGFGLDFRPLQNDEGVTLMVASKMSVRDVLHTAIHVRHGPPLHYLLVHASLAWRDDILGLRLPSALLGITAVAFSYLAGRELLGRAGGAIVSVVVASSPITIHLGQFARGYTAMMTAAFASLWLLLLLVRTRRLRWVAPYALFALMLVASHPFGLFALASELVLLVVLGLGPKLRHPRAWRQEWRSYVGVVVAAVLGLVALVLLHAVYSPLQNKYQVGHGGPVIHLGSSGFWSRLGDHVSGSNDPVAAILLGIAVVAGFAVLCLRNHRAAIVVGVWIGLPVALLSVFTAGSQAFAPERHLSFLMPGYAVALAALFIEIAQRVPRRAAPIAAVVAAGLLAAGLVADYNDLTNFNSGLRNASLALGEQFTSDDTLLSSAGKSGGPAEDPRLYTAYAALDAAGDSPLGMWRLLDHPQGCALVHQIQQRKQPQYVWALVKPSDAEDFAQKMQDSLKDGTTVQVFSPFVLIKTPVGVQTPRGALFEGDLLWRAAVKAAPDVHDFGHMSQVYRHAFNLARLGRCAG